MHDVCLRTENVEASKTFYEAMGLRAIVDTPHWAALAHGNICICLMDFLDSNMVNLRGLDVEIVYDNLRASGYEFDTEPETGKDGSKWSFKDPDGNVVFLDTTPEEATLSYQVQKFLEIAQRQMDMMGIEADTFDAFRHELLERYSSEGT